jgi:dephospho-CoA kinase
LSIPLLIENRLEQMVDRVLVIDTPLEVQIQRTMLRDNIPQSQVEQIINSQCSRAQRLASAHDVIINEGDIEALHPQIDSMHNLYLRLSKQTE